jgi:cell division septal protein FtsQ
MKRVRDFHSQSWNNPFFDRSHHGSFFSIFRSVGLAGLSAGFAYILVYSPLLRVGKVNVTGTASAEQIRINAATSQTISGYNHFVVPKNHLLALDPIGVKNKIMALYPNLISVEVKKTFNRLEIEVTERQPNYRLIIGDRSYLLDQEGLGIREAAAGEGDNLVALSKDGDGFAVGKQMIQEVWLKAINDLHKYFATHVGIRDRLYRINTVNDRLEVVTVEDWYAVIDPYNNIDDQLKTLSSTLAGKFNLDSRKNILYIDARFGDKVYLMQK